MRNLFIAAPHSSIHKHVKKARRKNMHEIASNKGFKKALMAFALVALMVIGPLGAIQQGSASVAVETRADEPLLLRVAMQDDIKTLNPLSAGDVWTWNVIGWVFDGLVWRNASNNDHIEPWAAEWFHHGDPATWSSDPYPDNDANDDYRNWTVKLRDDLLWHDYASQTGDNQYVRAHDVIFSLRLVADVARYAGSVECLVARNDDGSMMYGKDLPANGTIQLITYDGENVIKLPYWIDLSSQAKYPDLPVVYVTAESDDLTLHYFLTHDYADFTLDTLGALIFPERIWSSHIDEKLTWDDPEALINFGPFEFAQWDQTARVSRIDTFRDYFRVEYDLKGRPKPYIDGVLFKVYGTTDAAVMALTSDEVDYIAWAIDPGFIDTIVKDPDLTLVRNSDLGFFYVAFNMRIPDFGYAGYKEEGGDNPTYTGDYTDVGKPFRVAMAHLIDKQTIVTKFLQGFGSIGTSVVSPVNTMWYNPNIKIYNYDPEEAKRILDNAGYIDTDADGIRELPNLGESEITMLTPPADYDPIRAQSGLMIEQAATAAGLNFRSKPTNFGEIVNQINQHTFQMYMLGWSIPSPLSSATAPCSFFGSKNDVLNGGHNYPGYHNESFDQLCEEMNRELDINKRIQISKRLQEIVAEDVPYSVLYYRDVLEAYNKKFTGWVPRYGSIFNWYSLKEIRIAPPTDWELSIQVSEKVEGGTPVNLDAYLYKKSTNEPIPGVTITFSVDNGNLSSTTDVTDSGGRARVTFTPPVPEAGTVMPITITASTYDETADAEVKNIKIITAIPPPPTEYEIDIEFLNIPSTGIVTLDSGTPYAVQFQILNKNTFETYLEYVNTTGSGATVEYSFSLGTGASFEKYGVSGDGTWTYTFTGTADEGQKLTYVLKITATLIMDNETVSATSKDVQFTVIGPEPVTTTPTTTVPTTIVPTTTTNTTTTTEETPPENTPSVGIIPILVAVGMSAVAYNHYRRKKKS